MRIVCDRCGNITEESDKCRMDLIYSYSKYIEEGGDLRYSICLNCARILRPKIERMIKEIVSSE